jgi:VanZ family protein
MEQADSPSQTPDGVTIKPGAAKVSMTLGDWLPAILWMAVLFILSTTIFSAANTSKFIEPLLHWIFPSAAVATISLMHSLIRKAAHFTNYAILFSLLIRGPFKNRPYIALACCVAYAFLDEGHQIFVVGRGASLYDVALDSSGALFSRFLSAAVYEVAEPDEVSAT